MKAGETWDVPGVAFARRTGSENSIGPGILIISYVKSDTDERDIGASGGEGQGEGHTPRVYEGLV
jgi:hypothetical protein